MMRQIFAAIRAILASLPRLVMKKVFEAGEWVMRLMSFAPADAPPAPLPAEPAESVETIRKAAGVLAMGKSLEAQHIVGLAETTVAWLRALHRRQLCIVMSRRDDELKAHLKGTVRLLGLPASDRATVAALTEARKPRPTAKGYRTMRDRLAELESEKDKEPESVWAPAL